jgi:hypothetical protein
MRRSTRKFFVQLFCGTEGRAVFVEINEQRVVYMSSNLTTPRSGPGAKTSRDGGDGGGNDLI